MNKSKKLYNKALEKYNNGYIEQALELSEMSISLSMNNSAAINLKGLLYYIKGDLEESKSLWKMNLHINKDNVARKYLSDTEKDEKLLSIYNTALLLVKEMKINEATIMLKECSASHFNYINVNNYLAICYIKKGDYIRAVEHINNVLEVDKNNKLAIQSEKELIKTGAIDGKKLKVIPAAIALILIVAIGVIGAKTIPSMVKSRKNKNIIDTPVSTVIDKQEDKKEVENNIEEAKNVEIKEIEKFPYGDIKNYIDNKDYIKTYELVKKWEKKDLGVDEKSLLEKGKELLLSEGRETFYRIGSNYYAKLDYNEAKSYLIMAYEYGKDSWYYPYCIYTLGVCYEQTNNVQEAIRYYAYYDENFKKGEYKEIVLYNLSLLYKNIDIEKSKYYGNKLAKEYPHSIYNNSNIQNIINNNY